MIVVTGAGGFIGSCLISYLNQKGHLDIIAVDCESKKANANLLNKKYSLFIDRSIFLDWFAENAAEVNFVFHIGARTDTTEWDENIFEKLNVFYSKAIWKICTEKNIPMLYASSAATYGNGAFGYSDEHSGISKLKPLNPYGWSKQKMDVWVLEQQTQPDRWAGFKFFNVFGPNEYHKERMASVILHAYKQIIETGKVKLFKSNDPSIRDGEQKRDFVYVIDLLDVLYYFFEAKRPNGIYNLGSGIANTFLDLVQNVFSAIYKTPQIEFIEMPADLNLSYQNYTCADMNKLISIGYNKPVSNFKNAIQEYVSGYLSSSKIY
ncbi:MAG: ADP-glyceromanno-heptose 6-epimerase [Saprospiraceae bacterium]|nr:ADP-glyceromanno-heptose 6-epimerase [Saprospiraceae bacterium]